MAILQYEIAVVGEQAVHRALGSLERRFVQHQARVNRTLGTAGSARSAGAGGGASIVAAARREASAVDREQKRQQNYWSNAHRQAAVARMRDEDRRHKQAIRNAERETRIATKSAKETIEARRKFFEGAFGKVGGSVRGSLKATGALGAAALGIGGGFAISGAIQAQMNETSLASKLANQAGNPAMKGQLLKEARGVRGFTGDQTLGALSAFVGKTGDLDAGRKGIQDIADIALATGTDLTEMGEAAGNAFNVIADSIDDPKKRIEALKRVLQGWGGQGNIGAVEIADLAQFGGRLGASTRKFSGDPVDLLLNMGAMAQAAVRAGGASDAAEATTGVSRFAADLVKRPAQKALAGLGINVFADKNKSKLRDPGQIVADILDKTKGSLPQNEDIVNAESGKVLGGFADIYTKAEAAKKGTGREAVLGEFARYRKAALTDKSVGAAVKSRLEDPDLQFQEAMKEVNATLGEDLLPTLTKLIPTFQQLIPYVDQGAKEFARLAEAFAKDPVGGIMKLIAAKLAFDVAASTAADAGKKLADTLSKVSTQVSGAVPPEGEPGAGGKLGAAMLGAQLGITAATVIMTASVVNFEKGEADASASGKDLNLIRGLEEKAKTTKLTDEELSQARDAQIRIGKRETDAKGQGMLETMASGAISLAQYAGPVGWATKALGVDADSAAASLVNPSRDTNVATQSSMAAEADRSRAALEQLNAARALKEAADTLKGTALNRGNSPSPTSPVKG